MSRVVFVGAYAYARHVLEALPEWPVAVYTLYDPAGPRWQDLQGIKGMPPTKAYYHSPTMASLEAADLVVVAGWRRLVPIVAPTVGFHSAKLPEYPGRAPVANAILRGDHTITNTMLWLDEGVDTGDIIAERTFSIGQDPDAIYHDIGISSAEMLRTHWDGLLDGSAPRKPQDLTKRGPLTPADAWRHIAPVHEWEEAFG